LPIVPVGGALLGLTALAAAALFFIRKRDRGFPTLPANQRVTPWATSHRAITQAPLADLASEDLTPAEDIGEAVGVLISRAGSDFGSEYPVGQRPVSIGSGSRCAVRVPDSSLAVEEARLWVRKGHLMLHKMTRLTLIATEGVSGGWEILEPGDTFEIGEHRFEFRLLPEEAPEPQGDVPNVLRDEPKAPREAPLRPALADGPAADARPRLLEMMPHDLGFSSFEDGEEQQAS
jgi:hypothetical protein